MSWNVFDEMGNKVGEITENTGSDLGCFGSVLGIVILGGCCVFVVPALYMSIGLYAIIPFIIPIILSIKGVNFSTLWFLSFIISFVFCTVTATIVDGEFNMDIKTILMSLFISAALSTAVSVVSAFIGWIIRKIIKIFK